jgi:superfamily II DNA or RNA helicase
MPNPVRLRFEDGTLVVEGLTVDDLPPGFVYDARVGFPRAPADRYRQVLTQLHRAGDPYVDDARRYVELDRDHVTERTPRDYQLEAVAAWRDNGRRGVVVLPTGAGKSYVAELAIADARRSALVVAPTIDLVGQWYDGLRRAFGDPIGVLGGGSHEVHDITVSTYDSAWIHMGRYGARFGVVVFDEVHHLPGPSYAAAAQACLAPFRLGLSATPERPDGGHERLDDLIGEVVYRREITDLAGEFLADYRTECLHVHLSAEERAAWEENRGRFRDFVDSRGLRLGGPQGWNNFLREAMRSAEGRAAHRAWRDARRILQGTESKLRRLADLLARHADGRVIVFTSDNATVYDVSRRFLVPAITHRTDMKERRAILAGFADGTVPVVVTSRVLNEGVDVPAADVAIVLSGTGTVREHVQRLGRILRPKEGKSAVLYELVAAETTEEMTSRRRRDHAAYRP